MSTITTIFGMIVYTLVGLLFMDMVNSHIKELESKVAEYDPRYCERLWFHIKVTKNTRNEFLVDVLFMILWPIACVAAILKAEWQYDLIVHHSAFGNRAAR